jgi:maltodextrin utilization protein YvdJ
MIIENKDNEIIIRISANVNLVDIQKSLDFIRYKEILSKSKATAADAEALATEINTNWWNENKSKYISAK